MRKDGGRGRLKKGMREDGEGEGLKDEMRGDGRKARGAWRGGEEMALRAGAQGGEERRCVDQ